MSIDNIVDIKIVVSFVGLKHENRIQEMFNLFKKDSTLGVLVRVKTRKVFV